MICNEIIRCIILLSLTTTVATANMSTSHTKCTTTSDKNKRRKGIKEQQWQAMEQKVASWGDALGLGIDPEIKNTVIVLNLLGFTTEQSCQGHIDRGLPYAWISFVIQDEEIKALERERNDILKRISEKEAELQKKYPGRSLGEVLGEPPLELTLLYQKIHPLNDEIDRLSSLKLIRLDNLMTEFYKKRSIDRDRMLAFHELNRIYSLGGRWQVTRTHDMRVKKLQEYQAEMKLFTAFLMQHYFESQM